MPKSKFVGIPLAYFRRWRSRFRVLPAILVLAALTAIAMTTILPYSRQGLKFNSYRVEFLVSFLCVIYLRYEEKVRRYLTSRGGVSHEWTVRMVKVGVIIDKMAGLNRSKTGEIAQIRQDILDCVVAAIAEVLDLPQKTLCANLLDIGPEKRTMIVSARSVSVREHKGGYEISEHFLPWRAIANATMVIENNYQQRENLGPRDYKSIAVVPVTRGGLALGSLSIDCTTSFAFSGRRLLIFYQVRPYLSLLAQTYSMSATTHACLLNPAQIGSSED
jgi:hypothetical protein